MKKIMKTLSLMFAVGAMLFGSGLHHEGAEVAKAAGKWNLVTDVSDLKAGDNIIITDKNATCAMGAISTASTNYGTKINITSSSDVINDSDLPTTVAKLQLEGNSNGWTFTGIQTISGALTWISGNSLTSATSGADTWTITIDSDSIASIQNVQNTERYLQYNASSPRFACYTGSQQNVKIFKEEVSTKKLTEISLSGGYATQYNEGEAFDKANLVVTANYDDGTSSEVTDYTVSPSEALSQSDTVVTISYTEGEVTATKDISISVTARELVSVAISSNPSDVEYYIGQSLDLSGLVLTAIYNLGNPVELTSGFTSNPEEGYTFTSDDIGTYEITINFEGKITSFEVEVLDKPVYSLVEDASSLSVNDKIIIVAKNYDFALSTTQNNNNRGQAAVTKDGNTISFDETTQVITLEEGTKSGTFAFNVGASYLYAASASSNHLKTKTKLDDNGSWLITIATDGVATIKAQGTNTRNWLRYNNNDKLFSCYGSGQTDVAIYKEGSVVKKEIKSLSYEGTPTKTTYFEGESFDPTGLTINVTYGDGSTGTLAANALTWSPEVLTTGTSSVTGTYGEFSVIVRNIIVNPLPTFGFPTISNTTATGLMPETSGSSTENSYFLAGIVTSVVNSTWGNIYFKDAEGVEFYIYGTYLLDGTRYDAMSTKPQVGDAIVVYGAISNFNDSAQIKNAVLVSINSTILEETFKLASEVIEADACNSDEKQVSDFRTRYNALTSENQAIFNSITINSKSKHESDAATVTLINKLEYMETHKPISNSEGLSSNLLSSLTSSNNTLIVLIVGLLGLTSILGYYFLNKKKYSC